MINTISEMLLTEVFFMQTILGKYLDDTKRLFFRLGKIFYITETELNTLYSLTENKVVKGISSEKDYALYQRIKKYSRLTNTGTSQSEDIDGIITIKGNAISKATKLGLVAGNDVSYNTIYNNLVTCANGGLVDAMRILGILQCEGIFVDKNTSAGIANLSKCADWNDLKSVAALLGYSVEKREYNLSRLHMLVKDAPYTYLYEQSVKEFNITRTKIIQETKLLTKAFNAGVLKREMYEPKYARVIYSNAISLHDKEKAVFNLNKEVISAIADLPLKVAKKKDIAVDISWLDKEALKYCIECGKASVSLIQRRFPFGYIESCKIIDWMEEEGYISSSNGSTERRVLISEKEFNRIYGNDDSSSEMDSIKQSIEERRAELERRRQELIKRIHKDVEDEDEIEEKDSNDNATEEADDEKKTFDVTLFITQVYKELVEKANLNLRRGQTDTAILKRRAYFILDEFGNLPKIENIEGMVTVGRSRGIRYLFVLQSFSQLTAKYGREVGDIIKSNCNVKIFIGSDDMETRREFSELCGQKKVKNFSVNTSAENPASSNTGASNQPLITVGMLERLNGDEKGDAIVSVRGYEPIWTRFTPSYELQEIYFAAGKADISHSQGRLFEKQSYVYDILGGSQTKAEDKALESIERREQEQAKEESKNKVDIADLDKQWNDKVKEVHTKILKVAEALLEEDGKALLQAKLEDKLTLIRFYMDGYDQSVRQKLQTLSNWLEKELPKLKELQEQAKG